MPASGAAAWSPPRTPMVVVVGPSPPHRPPTSRPPLMATAAPTQPLPPLLPSPSCLEASTPRTQSPPRRGRGPWLVSGLGAWVPAHPGPSWRGLGCLPGGLCPPGQQHPLSGLLPLPLPEGKSLWVPWFGGLLGISWRLWVGKGFINGKG